MGRHLIYEGQGPKPNKTLVERIAVLYDIHEDLARIGFLNIKISGMNIVIYGLEKEVEQMKSELLEYQASNDDIFRIYGFNIRIKQYEPDWKMKFEACSNILERLRNSVWEYIKFRLKL